MKPDTAQAETIAERMEAMDAFLSREAEAHWHCTAQRVGDPLSTQIACPARRVNPPRPRRTRRQGQCWTPRVPTP